jgi:glycosyltransferase involved in cell wall biosynthesis
MDDTPKLIPIRAADRHAAHDGSHGPLLSVIIPVFNEERTIDALLRRVLDAPYAKQVIVVDDGSTDRTPAQLQAWKHEPAVEIHRQVVNSGKGAAIRIGIAAAKGRFVVIQDADLEYDPQDYPKLIEPLAEGTEEVVFGSRYLQRPEAMGAFLFRTGVRVINWTVRLLYRIRLTDEATCYKAMSTSLLKSLDLQCERFEFCPEVTAKLCRLGIRITEVPISYHARATSEGKKIRLVDGIEALQTLWRWRRWQPAKSDEPRILPFPAATADQASNYSTRRKAA